MSNVSFMLRPLPVLASFLLSLTIQRAALAQPGSEWQQRVRYEMGVRLDTERHRMAGVQRLVYVNNSPDTLRQVFYHLYFNAFHPGSMMAERNRDLPDPDPRIVPRIFELKPEEIGSHRVLSLVQNGAPLSFEVHDTVLRATLAWPIPPGDSAEFVMRFASQVPLMTRRSGRDSPEGIAYTMAQWYPKLAAYDERGWHADPYIGREFYAPFGTFDVRITLPARYVLGGTGVVQNPETVGHGYGSDAAPRTYAATDSLTWHFRAENVHDFAWVADPDYVHDRFTDATGLTYHVLYQPDVAALWQNERTWLPQMVGFFGASYGRYAYPQLTVAQGGDGATEYPMATFITGKRSAGSLRGTTAHEVAHQWFYAMLGSNETDHAWMDEGFANYIANEALAAMEGQAGASHVRVAFNMAAARHYGYSEPLQTPSDWFETNTAYETAAYSGGEMIASLLGYVLSQPLRDRFLQEYVARYTFRHPGPGDVERMAEEVSGLQLDWFFDQLLRTEVDVDYAVEDVRSAPASEGYYVTVRLARKGRTVLPVDLALVLEDSGYVFVNVPLSEMQGRKPVPSDWAVTEPWPWTAPEHTVTVRTPRPARRVHLDPFQVTPERNRLSDASRLPLTAAFLNAPRPSWGEYGVGYRPLGQYANGYGVGMGAQARGAYLFDRRQARAMVKLWPEVFAESGWPQWADAVDFDFSYSDVLPGNRARLRAAASTQKHFGFMESAIALSTRLGTYPWLRESVRTAELSLVHQYGTQRRPYSPHFMTLLLPQHTLSAIGRLSARDEHNRAGLLVEVGSGLQDDILTLTAVRAVLDAVRSFGASPFRLNAQLRVGMGDDPLTPGKQHRLGQAPAEHGWRTDAYRTIAAALDHPYGRHPFVPFSGAGPVAYSGVRELAGSHTIAGSLELVTRAVSRNPWLAPVRLFAFSGAGQVWSGGLLYPFRTSQPLFADAGVGLTYDVSLLRPLARWTAQSDVLSSLRLSARVPLWASEPSWTREGEPFALRWVFGVETDF